MNRVAISSIIISIFLTGLQCSDGSSSKREQDICNPKISEYHQKERLQSGDLIFQTSLSSQSKAIQQATHSQYSHCGIIFKEGDSFFVLEAIQPVKKTQLNKWIKRGENQHYVVKRLKNSDSILTNDIIEKMKNIGQTMEGKDYDLAFGWSDEKIYCSELIWKIYERATGLQIGKTVQLKDFDLSNATVKKKIHERYGNNIPLEETVISPAAIFNSELLKTVITD